MLRPSKELETTLRKIKFVLGRDYWLGFGGLWAIIMAQGVVPDGDLDLCVHYPYDWEGLIKRFEGCGYENSKVILNDCDRTQALYAGFNPAEKSKRDKFPHICVSFWYPACGCYWYCHDQNKELDGIGVPPSGYFLKGVPDVLVKDRENFCEVDWPGLRDLGRVRVPVHPGQILDYMYPRWAYRKMQYVPDKYGEVDVERMVSYHKGGVVSPFQVHLKSIGEFRDGNLMRDKLEKARMDYKVFLKKKY